MNSQLNLYRLVSAAFAFMLLSCFALSVSAQQINPNRLPTCPKPDYSKNTDHERFAKWTNCWGRYKSQLDGFYKSKVLEGEWLNGKQHGQGTYIDSNEYKYVGSFKDGKKSGHGTLTYANGDKYVGGFKDGSFFGQGTLTYVDHGICVGEWKDGLKNGQVTCTFSDGEKYVGEYRNSIENGSGTHTYANGDKYVGEFKNGNFNGKGTYTSANGDSYVGEHKDNKRHGYGIRTLADGTRLEGIWENDIFILEAKVNLPSASTAPEVTVDRQRSTLNTVQQPSKKAQNLELFAIQPQFDHVGRFSNDLSAVRIGDYISGKWGFIDKQGEFVINPQFDAAHEFHDGISMVRIGDRKTGKWGFINKQGEFVINPQFDEVHEFHDGLAGVRIGDYVTGKWGFINKRGEFVINPQFDAVHEFHDGLAGVRKGDYKTGKWGFIDKQGNFVIKPQFFSLSSFQEGLSSFRTGNSETGKIGFIDKQGKIVIKPKFDNVLRFQGGFASFRIGDEKNGKWGFIDNQGNIVIKPQFNDTSNFNEGLAAVRIGDRGSGKWGFIDQQGKLVINPQFDDVDDFHQGLAFVRDGDYETGKWGVIDNKGKFFLPPQFDLSWNFFEHFLPPREFSEGLAAACISENLITKCGFISKQAKQSTIIVFPSDEKIEQNENKQPAAIIAVQTIKNPDVHRTDIDRERKILAEERKSLEEEKRLREQAKASSQINLQVSATKPSADGAYTLSIQTNADTASLKINGEEIGGRADGSYTVNRIARAGQDTKLDIIATDIYNNSDFKTITVARQVSPSSSQTAMLKPETINRSKPRDAVAIIIGIQNYKRVPNAEFANNDAREFSEYAIRALGIKPEKIKMLLDEEADEVNIVKAFENWLPIQVNKDKTDVYIFYSGHGLPSSDGKSLYFLPHGVDKELLSRTAVAQNEIVAALAAAKPKSVTMFIDACYSGQTRGGDVLLANAKPVALKADKNAYPPNFTVITASANDQISSSSPELKHGIFSFYLMKGMEGDADANQDGKITVGEMQDYLSDKVARQATTLGRKQNTQFVGDSSRVLVAR